MKLAVSLLAALACLFASPALAQGPSSHYAAGVAAEPDTQVLGFIRIPLGGEKKRKDPVIGFGLFADCSRLRSQLSTSHDAACDARPVRALEFTRQLNERDWLLSFSNEKRWVGIARWFPDSGFARVREYGPVLDRPDRSFEGN